jgi:hypothetical protein
MRSLPLGPGSTPGGETSKKKPDVRVCRRAGFAREPGGGSSKQKAEGRKQKAEYSKTKAQIPLTTNY